MNLIGEQFVPNKKVDKSKTTKRILLVAIILTVIAIITIMIAMVLFREKKLVIRFNGVTNSELGTILNFDENGKLYIPIRDIASYFEYESYNGNYIDKSENSNECYVETNEEVASFELKSNKLEKIDKNTQETTFFYIDEPVKLIDGKLCTTPDGIEKAYNTNFKYNADEKQITIQTMDYLIEIYTDSILESGYENISDEFNNKKSILNDLVIVEDSRGQQGVIDLQSGNEILETKYTQIQYIPTSGDFLVENNGLFGIFTSKGKEKIKLAYDDLELISQDLNMYVVKKDNKYGVINQNEKEIIPLNCDDIGVDLKTFSKNNINNNYVILENIIPVKKNDLWGLYDIEGNKLTDYKYDSFGCTSSKERNTENIIIVPDYKVIIGQKENEYVLINQYGEELLNGLTFEEIYMTIDLNDIKYFAVKNETRYNLIELLEKIQNSLNNNSKTQ